MKKLRFITIALDFDGTVVRHKYPEIGQPVDNALYTIKLLLEAGATIYLDTMRKGKYLDDAIEFFISNGVNLHGYNINPNQPEYLTNTKLYRDMYIGDDALGCPLSYDHKMVEDGVFVDWHRVEELLFPKKIKVTGAIKPPSTK